MPAADFCIGFVRLPARAVQLGYKEPQGTRCRTLEVSSTTFRTLPPEFTSDVLDGYALRGNLPARPPPAASYPILVFFFSSRRRHTRLTCDWSSDVCSSD